MPERPFICTPSSWLTDPLLNRLSDDAELLFRRLCQCTDRYWQLEFDPDNREHTIRTAVFSPQRRFRAWNPDRIRRSLSELTAAGMLIQHFQGDRHWWQVADAYRYERGRESLIPVVKAQQPELPIERELFALPSPGAPSRPRKATPPPPVEITGQNVNNSAPNADNSPSAAPRIPVREEKEETRVVVVPRATAAPPSSVTEHNNNDNDGSASTIPELSTLSLEELEARAKALGANLRKEDERWRQTCARQGWSEDQRGWHRWLLQVIDRRPRPRTATTSTASGSQSGPGRISTTAPGASLPIPTGWREFLLQHYPAAAQNAAESYTAARQRHPALLQEFTAWQQQPHQHPTAQAS